MKKIIQTIFIFSAFYSFTFSTSLILCAQDTLYYDKNNKITEDKELATSYRLHTVTEKGEIYRHYKMDGTLYKENIYTYLTNKLKIDTLEVSKLYTKNKLYWERPLKNGKSHGHFVVYWENGKLKRKDKYANGKFIKGVCYDESGKKIPYYEFERLPEFPGGMTKLYEYLSSDLKYPEDARQLGVQGQVLVDFAITIDGSIVEVKVKTPFFESLDKEAIRVVSEMPKWKPGMQDGKLVRVYYQIPIRFTIN
jgi:TonB family protein